MEEVKYHPKALAELFRSAQWYDRRLPGLGNEFFEALDAAVSALRQDPQRHRADADGVRNWRLHRFPFRIHYVIDPGRIRILAVAHGKRREGYWQRRIDD
jgi:mRNA-degrading endonuclease RelE of RelBE toxin-antitoxin system